MSVKSNYNDRISRLERKVKRLEAKENPEPEPLILTPIGKLRQKVYKKIILSMNEEELKTLLAVSKPELEKEPTTEEVCEALQLQIDKDKEEKIEVGDEVEILESIFNFGKVIKIYPDTFHNEIIKFAQVMLEIDLPLKDLKLIRKKPEPEKEECPFNCDEKNYVCWESQCVPCPHCNPKPKEKTIEVGDVVKCNYIDDSRNWKVEKRDLVEIGDINDDTDIKIVNIGTLKLIRKKEG